MYSWASAWGTLAAVSLKARITRAWKPSSVSSARWRPIAASAVSFASFMAPSSSSTARVAVVMKISSVERKLNDSGKGTESP